MKPKNLIRTLLLAAAAMPAFAVHAQGLSAFEYLDANNVKARVNVAGDLFHDLSSQGVYHVPRNSPVTTMFASALWFGGLENNNVKLAAMTYRQNGADFYAGPLDRTTANIDPTTSHAWDKIWKITRAEIEAFKKNGTISPAIRDWPAHTYAGGVPDRSGIPHDFYQAPFVDVDGDGEYRPSKGDYPDIKGDVMLWWVFNDKAGWHYESQGVPIGLEVQAMAYAFNCPDDALLYNTIFFDYKLINRSSGQLDSTYAGIWTDFDLGNALDDYVGCYPAGNAYFAYNGDPDDGSAGYGKDNIPVQSVVMLSHNLNGFLSNNNSLSNNGNPVGATEYYNYLRSRWRDGQHLTEGGNGTGGQTPTTFMYPGDPAENTQWSEVSAGNDPGDRRGLGSVFLNSFKPGAAVHLVYAYTFNQVSSGDISDNLALMRRNALDLKKRYDAGLSAQTSCLNTGITAADDLSRQISLYPNPANGTLNIRLESNDFSNIRVVNSVGQVMWQCNNQLTGNTMQLNTASWASGIYTLQIRGKQGQAVKKVVIQH